MKTKHLLTVLLFALASLSASAQIGVTSYSIYSLGVNTNKDKPISGELKGFFNNKLYDLSFEASLMYNFKAREYYRFSVGAGIDFSPFVFSWNAVSMPCQLEIFPLKDFKRLSLVFELSPQWWFGGLEDEDYNGYFEDYGEDFSVRYLWGIRYTFNGSK
ncbi:hypothetical protein FACS189474_4840 [Bacteroidia bacterium]|nr:hypothetical protein FACS189474_4840 [Bacteroidia bacterium]